MVHSLFLSPGFLTIRAEEETTRHIEVCWMQRVRVQRGVIYTVYSQRCSLCVTYCSFKTFLCCKNSSCLLPWCAECRLSGRWWTFESVNYRQSSLFCLSFSVLLFISSALCKREATLPFIDTSFHGSSWACRKFLGLLLVCSGVECLEIQNCLLTCIMYIDKLYNFALFSFFFF